MSIGTSLRHTMPLSQLTYTIYQVPGSSSIEYRYILFKTVP